MAGLLTYSRTLNAFPASPNPSKGGEHRFKSIDLKLRSAQWHEFVQYVFLFQVPPVEGFREAWSLQQRVCSGFSPDSLFITISRLA
jgi:hypothetical protein